MSTYTLELEWINRLPEAGTAVLRLAQREIALLAELRGLDAQRALVASQLGELRAKARAVVASSGWTEGEIGCAMGRYADGRCALCGGPGDPCAARHAQGRSCA